ncbi:MAG: biopolymer transporter ExbD [Deltaproteobacteria bacterium]|nr:biopolymer transporter ExbD [Deltaproteobacteria bacterium]
MAGHSQAQDDEIGGINVTPFVDIALVLLIIFMVTAKYIVAQQIPVDLPQAATSQSAAEVRLASIAIDREQRLFLDGQPATEVELRAELQRRWEADHEIRAVIAADRNVIHGRVTEVIDLVRQAGVTHFAIQTEPPSEPAR